VKDDALIVALLGAASVVSITLAFTLPAIRRAWTVRRRLRGYVAFARDETGPHETPGHAGADPLSRWLSARLARARVDLSVGELALAMIVFAAGMLALAFSVVGRADLVAGLVALPLGGAMPVAWLVVRERRIQRRFAEQLPDTVALISNTLHAGLSLPVAFEQVARDAMEPTRGAFEVAVREMQLGADLSQVLQRLGRRFPSEDLDLVVAAIDLHRQTGGDLPRVLDTIVTTLRERARVWGDVKVLTSQQRYSAYVLAALPIVVGAALFLISPDYVGVMFEHGLTRAALGLALALVVAGFWLMRRLGAVDA
jgi:tight adherence protein B